MSYLTATGQIRVLEKKLLDETDIERMIDAKDANEAIKVFNDTDLADNLLDVKPEEYQKALDDDLTQTKEFLKKATPNVDLLKLMFLEDDFHNIKVLLKMKCFDVDLFGDLTDVGAMKIDELKEYILGKEKRKEKREKSDDKIWNITDGVIAEFDLRKDDSNNPLSPSEIDLILDKKYFEMGLRLAKKIGNDFVIGYVQRRIDMTNLKAMLRAKNMARPEDEVKQMLIAGGEIDLKKLLEFYDKDIDELSRFLRTYLTRTQEKFLSEYDDKKYLWQLEKGIDNLEMDRVKETKMISYGPEIVFGYWQAKMNAARNVRLIMTGKLNNIPADEIKKRVRNIF